MLLPLGLTGSSDYEVSKVVSHLEPNNSVNTYKKKHSFEVITHKMFIP